MKKQNQYIVLTLVVRPEDGQFAGYCPQLGTATCGDTIEEALANLKDAVQVHLDALEKLGERHRFFREHGITVRTAPKERMKIEVPAGTIAMAHVVPA